jgi:hypothetical protein
MSNMQLGAFFFYVKHCKEDEREIIATDVTPCKKVFNGSNILCNEEMNQDKKLEPKSDLISSLFQSPGACQTKMDT